MDWSKGPAGTARAPLSPGLGLGGGGEQGGDDDDCHECVAHNLPFTG